MTVRLFPRGIPVVKRLFDLLLTIPGVILISPLLLVLAVLVRIYLGAPVIFRQRRPGYRGEIFTLYKFRSMRDATDSNGKPLPDSERLTRLGRFLRALSLDELPELWNVLKGELSLVGPRPLLIEYLPLYSAEQARRHDVLPGITGWAQVNGRNTLSWQDKFRLDVWYVDHWSLWLDIRILALTFLKVICREGISAAGTATAPLFTGNADSSTSSEEPE
jgi:lipopolysaccharide/colanic/teichoic acid biosynthesis glycosyltransferase